MSKIPGEKRFAAFFLSKPNVSYDVQITFTDPDGIIATNPVHTTVTTRSDVFPLGSGKAYYVSPYGNDSNPGTPALPFKTIAKAALVVAAGDTVYVKAGTYRERVDLRDKAGIAANWITFQAFGDGPVILDGSDPALLATGQNRWSVYSGQVYRTPLSYTPAPYVAIDGLRAYHHPSLASLVSGIAGIPAGWCYDGTFLYLQTKDGSDPDQHAVQVAKTTYGFELARSHYIKIKGFTIQYYGGAGIRLNGGETNILIEDNAIRNNFFGIRKGGQGGSRYTIQRNTITDTEVFAWPWNQVKKTEHEAAGIILFAIDQGAVVRDNTVSGYFDGIDLNYWSPALGYNFDSDISRNTIIDCGDDATELEGSNQTNIRFWDNTMIRCFTGMSVTPVLRGPVYLFRNVGYQIIQQGFKVGSAGYGTSGLESVGAVYAYHNTIHAIDDVGNDDDGVQCTNTPSYQNHTYRNNVFYTGRYVVVHGFCTSAGITYDYDLMYTKDTSRFIQWDNRAWYPTLEKFQAATGQALHAINALPVFEDLASGDLRLRPTSPGIDAGTVLVGFNDANSPWPSAGSRPDMGTFETSGPAPVNQPPVLNPIGNNMVKEGELLTFAVTASDPDGDTLIYSVGGLPAGATWTGLTFAWKPGAGQAGTYQLTFTVSDGKLEDAETITITVQDATPTNQPPVLALIGNKSVKEGQPLTFAATATDPDGDLLTYTATNLPTGATFTGLTFTWTPTVGQAGTYEVTVAVSDGKLEDVERVTITVLKDVASLTISGTIRDLTGQPLPGVRVRLKNVGDYPDGRRVETTTDAQGQFALSALQTTEKLQEALAKCQAGACEPLTAEIEPRKEGWGFVPQKRKVSLDPTHLQDITGLQFLAVVEEADPLTLTVSEKSTSVTLSGTIHALTGQPLPGVRVRLKNVGDYPDGRRVETTTDAQGQFALSALQTTEKLQEALAKCQAGACEPLTAEIEPRKEHWVLSPARIPVLFNVTADEAAPSQVTGIVFLAMPETTN